MASNGGTEHLAWLLGCLDSAVECLDWCGRDVDAKIVEAHRAELAAGREWPGQPVTCPPQFVDTTLPALVALPTDELERRVDAFCDEESETGAAATEFVLVPAQDRTPEDTAASDATLKESEHAWNLLVDEALDRDFYSSR